MADNSTIGVNLGGVITTSGALNSQVLQSLADFLITQGYSFETLPKSALPAPGNVFVTLADDPTITLPENSPGINTGGFDATITGGGAVTAILAQTGNLHYNGGAGQVFAANGTGVIGDTAAVATITAIDGTYSVTGLGADSYVLGGAAASVTAQSGGNSRATLQGNTAYQAGSADTVVATAGVSTVFGNTGDFYSTGDASMVFVGGSGSKVLVGGAATSNFFAGAGGAATIVTGSAGDVVFFQGTRSELVSGGGTDTVWGGDNTVSPTIFGTNNSYELLVSNMKGGLAIGMGNNTTLDGANTTGGLTYFANPGYGNQTFIGSAGGNDTFVISPQTVGQSLITIENWHGGDLLNVSAFGAADQATAAAALKAGGNGLFKLSDGTTVSFQGAHPTTQTGGFFS